MPPVLARTVLAPRGLDRRGLVAAGLSLALGGCVATSPPRLALTEEGGEPGLEPLLGIRAEADGLVIRLASRGCLSKADLTFYVARRPEGAAIAFARRRLETCPRRPSPPVELRFSYDELGVAPRGRLTVLNPMRTARAPG